MTFISKATTNKKFTILSAQLEPYNEKDVTYRFKVQIIGPDNAPKEVQAFWTDEIFQKDANRLQVLAKFILANSDTGLIQWDKPGIQDVLRTARQKQRSAFKPATLESVRKDRSEPCVFYSIHSYVKQASGKLLYDAVQYDGERIVYYGASKFTTPVDRRLLGRFLYDNREDHPECRNVPEYAECCRELAEWEKMQTSKKRKFEELPPPREPSPPPSIVPDSLIPTELQSLEKCAQDTQQMVQTILVYEMEKKQQAAVIRILKNTIDNMMVQWGKEREDYQQCLKMLKDIHGTCISQLDLLAQTHASDTVYNTIHIKLDETLSGEGLNLAASMIFNEFNNLM